MRKDQVERLSALQKAGKQKNKIDAWVVGQKRMRSSAEADESTNKLRKPSNEVVGEQKEKERHTVSCPICEAAIPHDGINEHLDELHVS